LREFANYLEMQEIDVHFGLQFFAKGLCFQSLEAPAERAVDIAVFTAVRALRQMPELRALHPMSRSSAMPNQNIRLPDNDDPFSKDVRVAIFDGGIPENHLLTRWVTQFDFPNLMQPSDDILNHGVGVSSAALFGNIDPQKSLPRPYCYVDHYRVIDDNPNQNSDELYEVLERIESILASCEYDFINLSLGPRLPIKDDEVHAWTALLGLVNTT